MANTSATGGYLTPTTETAVQDLDLDVVFQRMVAGITGLPGDMVRPRVQPVNVTGAASPLIPNQDVDWCAIGVTTEEPDDDPYVAHDSRGDGQDGLQRYVAVEILAGFYGPRSGFFAGRLARTSPLGWSSRRSLSNKAASA